MGIDNKRVSKEGAGRPGTSINKSGHGPIKGGGILNPSSLFFEIKGRDKKNGRN